MFWPVYNIDYLSLNYGYAIGINPLQSCPHLWPSIQRTVGPHLYRILYALEWRTVSVLARGLFGVYFPSCEATKEINTKITLEWAQKQFVTRVHTLLYPPQRSLGGYTGFTLFVGPSVRLSVCLSVCLSVRLSVRPSVRPWVGVRMITLILFSGFNFFFYIYHLGQDLAWDWISASYLIKYAHTGRSCDLLIFGIPEVNFLVRAFQFGMTGVLSGIYDISPGFCWIPIFVFFLNFLRVS